MGNVVLVYGPSGSGKSTSLKNFGEDEIFLVNVQGKRPPFRKSFKYSYVPQVERDGKAVDTVQTIINALIKMDTKGIRTAVVDDCGYLMTQEFMAKHTQREGSKQFDLYNEIADSIWNLINTITRKLPEETIVYLMFHEITSDYGTTKIRTIGRLLDEKVCIEGMATVCIRCMTDGKRHWFSTQNNGADISKSPEGMLPPEMPNDLKQVDSLIREYWGFAPVGEQVQVEAQPAEQPAEQPKEEPEETVIDDIEF